MNEKKSDSNHIEQRPLTEGELWSNLLKEKEATDRIRHASKALKFFTFLAKHTDSYSEGKINPLFSGLGIVIIGATPFVLTEIGSASAAFAFADVAAALGVAAFFEKKLPVASGSEGKINKKVAEWIIDIKKIKMDGGDVARILLNLPGEVKSPEDIRRFLEEDDSKNKKKDPYSRVAKSVQGIIAVGKNKEFLDEKELEETKIETIRLMLEGQIEMQREIKNDKHIAREGIRMAANAGAGAGTGIFVASLINYYAGTQYGGILGALDDAIFLGLPYFVKYIGRPLKNGFSTIVGKGKDVYSGINSLIVRKEKEK